MNPDPASRPSQPPTARRYPLLFAAVAFLLGAVLTGVLFQKHRSGTTGSALSPATKNLLAQLSAPVTIRYYSLLPAGSTDEALQAFAGRVTQLLAGVQTAAGGKVEVTTIAAPTEPNDTAASADGLQPFNLDKGEACFLGLAIAGGKSKESFARLQPEWEPALEYDLARAIARVAAGNAPPKPAPEVAQPSSDTIASIKKLIPDVNTVSVEQADQIFHAEYLKQCGEVGADVEAQINLAQQQVAQAQSSGDAAALEAARKNLARVQLAQADRLKALATQLQTQLAVFQQMKAGAAKKSGN